MTNTQTETGAAARPGAGPDALRDSTEVEVTSVSLERREIPSFSLTREARIAEAAYWRAERRGFEAGRELDDWLEAEREVDSQLEGLPASQPAGHQPE